MRRYELFTELSEENKKEFLNKHNLLYVEFINSYNNSEQDIGRCFLPHTENVEHFLTEFFSYFEADQIEDLYKISTCCYHCTNYPNMLKERNGKFYFNIEVNKDIDTLFLSNLKDEYVLNHITQE